MKSPISTHVLDTSTGQPAHGLLVILQISDGGDWRELGRGETDSNGRLQDLLATAAFSKGQYRLIFETEAYFAGRKVAAFYPQVIVTFIVRNDAEHFHVPLLLSPYGYSTYRGS